MFQNLKDMPTTRCTTGAFHLWYPIRSKIVMQKWLQENEVVDQEENTKANIDA